MLGVIRNLILDFIFYFVTAYEKVPYTCNISTGYSMEVSLELFELYLKEKAIFSCLSYFLLRPDV